jgi:hypothetical protein
MCTKEENQNANEDLGRNLSRVSACLAIDHQTGKSELATSRRDLARCLQFHLDAVVWV